MAEVPDAAARLREARVGRLGTVGADAPHLVPFCFAVDEPVDQPVDGSLQQPVAYSAVDDKPKRTVWLQRLANVAEHPYATLLVDHYDEDWSALWWIRVSGPARVITEGDEHARAVGLLRRKYPQYAGHALSGPVLAIELREWRTWMATPG
jgi:PPOX class probable F420-dependent enzyme